jgi:predicted nucleic acid-binding protein
VTVALDTNVLLRFMVRDDPQQWQAADALISSEHVVVPAGVWLEFEWVMRNAYGLGRPELNAAMRDLFGLENLSTDCASQLVQALDWHEQGMDFADAFHLASSGRARRFATFDRDFRNRGNNLQRQVEVFTP